MCMIIYIKHTHTHCRQEYVRQLERARARLVSAGSDKA